MYIKNKITSARLSVFILTFGSIGEATAIDTVVTTQCTSTGATYYVSTNGKDTNTGTVKSPWKSIQKAMNTASAGSTVNIVAGTYKEKLTLNVQGTSGLGNCITFQPNNFKVPASGICGGYSGISCGGDKVILDYTYLGTDATTIPFLYIGSKSYVRIQGITFQNFKNTTQMAQGVRIDGNSNYIEFKYNRFLNNKSVGGWGQSAFLHFRTWGPSTNVWIYGNEFGNLVTTDSETLTADDGATLYNVENNWFHDIHGIAIDLHGGSNQYNVRLNLIEYAGINRSTGKNYYAGGYPAAIYNDGGNTGIIERNALNHVVHGFSVLSEPFSTSTIYSSTAHDVTIRDNVVQNSYSGVVLGTWYTNTCNADTTVYNVNLFNNTFYANTYGVAIRPFYYGITWKNNILANNTTAADNPLGCPTGVASNNLYFGGGTGSGANNVYSNPLFANASSGNFALSSGSAAINAGETNTTTNQAGAKDAIGNNRFNGLIDIGAYEK